jgi:hypothetical protein
VDTRDKALVMFVDLCYVLFPNLPTLRLFISRVVLDESFFIIRPGLIGEREDE